MNTSSNYHGLITRLFVLVVVVSLSGCEDQGMSPAEREVAAFSQQLQGDWILDKVTLNKSATQTVTIAPVREFACDKLISAFKAKDVVNQYEITYSDKIVHVKKRYTCRLAPEELSWQIMLDENSAGDVNWMSGKSFTIREVNEATVHAELKLLFFNLENYSPDGKPATASTSNKLWLEVVYDSKEDATFRLEFSKTK